MRAGDAVPPVAGPRSRSALGGLAAVAAPAPVRAGAKARSWRGLGDFPRRGCKRDREKGKGAAPRTRCRAGQGRERSQRRGGGCSAVQEPAPSGERWLELGTPMAPPHAALGAEQAAPARGAGRGRCPGGRGAQLARRDGPQRRDALIGSGAAGSRGAGPRPRPERPSAAAVEAERRVRAEGGAAGGAWGAVV